MTKKKNNKRKSTKKKDRMEWEIIEKDDLYYIYLKKKYWKFKDQPVCYCKAITKKAAEECLQRLNHPLFDEEL